MNDPAADVDALIAHLHDEGRTFGAVAAALNPAASVPSCPGWDVQQLIRHLGMTHRWAADIVAHARTERPRVAEFAPAPEVDLLAWYQDGVDRLVQALTQAPAELQCVTLYPASNGRWFWATRQAVETAVHRADAELAAEVEPGLPAEVGEAGITEMLANFGPRIARGKRFARSGVIELEPAEGPSWTVTVTADGLSAAVGPASGPIDARVCGSSSQLLLWLWNRPSGAAVEGDGDLTDQWAENIRI